MIVSTPSTGKRYSTTVILGAVLCAAIFLRFFGIFEKGIYEYDEGDFLLRIRSYTTLSRVLPQVFFGHLADLRTWSHEAFPSGFFPSTSALPALILPLSFIATFIGEHVWLPSLWHALLGTLTVLLVYLLAKRLSGESAAVGIFAALLLALSPYHVLYSRMSEAQLSAGFFLTLSAFFYVESFYREERVRYRYLFGSGIGLGLMFSSHYGTLPVLFIFAAWEFVVGLIKYRGAHLGRWGVIAAGVAGPLLLWQGLLFARATLFTWGGMESSKVQSYAGEVIGMVREIASSSTFFARDRESFFYLDLLQHSHGWLFMGMFVASPLLIFFGPRQHRIPALFTAWIVIVPTILYSMVHFQVTRTYVVYVPLALTFTALAFGNALAFVKISWARSLVLAALAAGILIPNFSQLRSILRLRSSYAEASERIRELSKEYTVVATPWAVYQYYTNMRLANFGSAVPDNRPVVYVADWLSLDGAGQQIVQERFKPFLEIPVNVGTNYLLIRDTLYYATREEARRLAAGKDPRTHTIRFYHLGYAYTNLIHDINTCYERQPHFYGEAAGRGAFSSCVSGLQSSRL